MQRKSTERVLIPKHWVNVIAQAKKNEPKFTVIEMEQEDFFSSEHLEKGITNRKTAMNGEKVNWLNIRKIINNRKYPFEFAFENYSVCPLAPVHVSLRKRGEKTIQLHQSSVLHCRHCIQSVARLSAKNTTI